MDNFQGNFTLVGSGADSLAIDDTGSGSTKTATLTPTALTGLSSAFIHYSGLSSLTIGLGTGGDSFTITNTNSTTTTNVNLQRIGARLTPSRSTLRLQRSPHLTGGGGADHFNIQSITAATSVVTSGGCWIVVGSAAPSLTGNVNGIQAALSITGASTDTLTVDDSASSTTKTGTLSATALTGLGMNVNGITYTTIGTINVGLGTGANTFTITNTAAVTNLTAGNGGNTINLQPHCIQRT